MPIGRKHARTSSEALVQEQCWERLSDNPVRKTTSERPLCRGAATTLSLGSDQCLEPRIVPQVAPPPADVLALHMPRVGSRVALQQRDRGVTVTEQRPLVGLEGQELLPGVGSRRGSSTRSIQHVASTVLETGTSDYAASAELSLEDDVRTEGRRGDRVEQSH